MDLFAVILAGGSGNRLWPLSRAGHPKHLLSLDGRESLLQQTLRRLLRLLPPRNVLIVTRRDQEAEVRRQFGAVAAFPPENVLSEPEGRNTLPAALWASRVIVRSKPDATIGIFPSDHLVTDEEAFRKDVAAAADAAQDGFLVTFGIRPTEPSTGFGYVQTERPLKNKVLKAARFVEKPDLATAQGFLAREDYFWNSGMFVFKASCFLEEAARWQPAMSKAAEGFDQGTPAEDVVAIYASLPSVSIDTGVMEKSDQVALVPASFGWSDLGSWKAVYDALEKDGDGNVLRGRVRADGTRSSLLLSSQGVLAGIGLENMVVVRSGDSVLVCSRDRAEDVKKIAEAIPQPSATTERPWGRYTVLEEGPGYKLKRIVVEPGQKLSLQRHQRRAEHWVVIEGTAKVINSDREVLLQKNESTFIPIGEKHRLENPGAEPLIIIEVQTGDYVGEDDIERLEDVYGRPTKSAQ